MATVRLAGPATSRTAQLYWAVAGLLFVWIIVLLFEQPYAGRVHALVLTSVGIAGAAVAGMLVTAVLIQRRSPFAAMGAAFTATVAFIMSWFHLLTGTAVSITAALIGTATVVAPVVVISGWVARRLSADRAAGPPLPGWAPWVYLAAGAVLVVVVVRVALITPGEHDAWHLRLVWTGLDVFEFVAIAATARHLQRRSPALAVTATTAGTLLLSDAWFNIAGSTGTARMSAIAMGFVEVPLAAVSFALAAKETRSWIAWKNVRMSRLADGRGAR
jgi:MFS family permease